MTIRQDPTVGVLSLLSVSRACWLKLSILVLTALLCGCGPRTTPYEEECPSGSIGSDLGEQITGGWLGARANNLSGSCGGEDGSEFAWIWSAPKTGTYVFTTEESNGSAVIYLLEGTTCEGEELACGAQSGYAEVSRSFERDESVVVVVDGKTDAQEGVNLTIRRSFDDNPN